MKIIPNIPPFIYILMGISLIAISIIQNCITSANVSKALTVYTEKVSGEPSDYLEAKKEMINEYNKTLKAEDYDKLDEVVGYIEIPAINIKYPIYRYETEENLNKGIAHVSGTHLPSKGKGTHGMFLGHTGEYSNELFTHLDQLMEGDGVFITVLDKKYIYEVCDIKVVLPEEVTCKAKKNENLITLVTCTPYGANTHRLLVTCKQREEQND